MKKLTSALLAVFFLTASAAALSACNTTAGAGEDMSAAGHAVTNSAESTKDKM